MNLDGGNKKKEDMIALGYQRRWPLTLLNVEEGFMRLPIKICELADLKQITHAAVHVCKLFP